MSNGARHGFGVLIGLVVTPVIALCLMYGATKFMEYYRYFITQGGADRWVGAAVILAAAVLVGLVAGSRVSPLASLIPGAVYAAVGLLWVASPRFAVEHAGRDLLGRKLYLGYTTLGPYGVFLLLGVALLVASLAPSRWKSRKTAAAAPSFGGPPPAPMGPPPMHGAPSHMGAPQPHPAPGQAPPWQAPQQYGPPPAQPAGQPPASHNPPPLPPARPAEDRRSDPPAESGSDDDDPPGEWTQMYGGNRPS
ncbi:hypothetical protein [Actinomadura sp. WMMA1423]|uniref:hypothetical protein n=1 Tax=Actinomadura sp. WMMA1423 TaxID=2591108 RepID=UPI001146EA89|nr:hypothetical protein [Actinomadura sp. WMMA1423]